jgi:hypothetical protein
LDAVDSLILPPQTAELIQPGQSRYSMPERRLPTGPPNREIYRLDRTGRYSHPGRFAQATPRQTHHGPPTSGMIFPISIAWLGGTSLTPMTI